MSQTDERNVKYSVARRFIIKLGIIAHGYGPSASRLEQYLRQVTESLGYHGIFSSNRSEIIFSFWDEDEMDQKMHISALEKGGFNMAKLARVGELVEGVVEGGISLDDAYDLLDKIEALPNPWGKLTEAVSFMFVGVGFSGLMSGNIWDLAISGLLALFVFGNLMLAGRFGECFSEALPFVSAFIVGFMAALFKIYIPEINVSVITISAIIIIIPGFSISAGIVEIVSNHVVSGSANLIDGLVNLMKLFFGAWFGIATVGLLWPTGLATNVAIVQSSDTLFFLPLLFIGLGVGYQSLPKDFPWVVVCCAITYMGIMFGSSFDISYLGTLLGAIMATLFANFWSGYFSRPRSIVLVPAITVMVSGSVGFQGLLIAAGGESDRGIDQFLQMFVVALVIAAGLLIANTIVRPRVTL